MNFILNQTLVRHLRESSSIFRTELQSEGAETRLQKVIRKPLETR